MRATVGIDLSAEPKSTAIACIDWTEHVAGVSDLHVGASDELVLHWMHHPDGSVGIDCPFGWPAAFVDLVHAHTSGALHMFDDLAPGWRRQFTLRETDRWIQGTTGLTPLSVSADRIGHTALRLAALRSKLGNHIRAPLDGSGNLAEVYPAAALKVWGLPFQGYKRAANAKARGLLVDQMQMAAPWLSMGQYEEVVRESDNALDAVLCGLIARAVEVGATFPPDNAELALTEGWIHLPSLSLGELGPG